jgi:hypothetical protein
LGIAASGAGRADKITHAVGGQRIEVKVKVAFMGSPAVNASVLDLSQTAVSGLAFGNSTFVNAKTALNTVF